MFLYSWPHLEIDNYVRRQSFFCWMDGEEKDKTNKFFLIKTNFIDKKSLFKSTISMTKKPEKSYLAVEIYFF